MGVVMVLGVTGTMLKLELRAGPPPQWRGLAEDFDDVKD